MSNTPNLEYLDSRLDQLDKEIKINAVNISTMETNVNAWNGAYLQKKALYESFAKNTLRKKDKAAAKASMDYNLSRLTTYRTGLANYKAQRVTLINDRNEIAEAITNYQSAVVESISQGGTDAGSERIINAQVELAEAELDSLAEQTKRTAEEAEEEANNKKIIIIVSSIVVVAIASYFIYRAVKKSRK